MFDEFCRCGHTKEEHVEKWFSKGIKCLGDDCKCDEFRPTKRSAAICRKKELCLGREPHISRLARNVKAQK